MKCDYHCLRLKFFYIIVLQIWNLHYQKCLEKKWFWLKPTSIFLIPFRNFFETEAGTSRQKFCLKKHDRSLQDISFNCFSYFVFNSWFIIITVRIYLYDLFLKAIFSDLILVSHILRYKVLFDKLVSFIPWYSSFWTVLSFFTFQNQFYTCYEIFQARWTLLYKNE